MKYFVTVIVLFFSVLSFSQAGDASLAYKYYQNKEFAKAAVLFEKLYNKKHSSHYLSNTVYCLVKIKDFSKAEKLLKKHIRKNKNNVRNYVELGYVYKAQGDIENANKNFNHALDNVHVGKYQIIELANIFLNRGEFDFADKTYEKGSSLLDYQFHLERANSYAYQRKHKNMIEEYLDYLKADPTQMTFVQKSLQRHLDYSLDEDISEILKKTLIVKIQKETDFYLYNELLIWLYIQQKNFDAAVIQAKALDKRRKEEGFRMLELGKLALQNDELSIADEAFEYVMNKGKSSMFYSEAKEYHLYVFYKLVTLGKITKTAEIEKLASQYSELIKEHPKMVQRVRLTGDLAHLQAFYLDKADDAVVLLQNVITNKQIDEVLRAFCKIELGDILMLQNDVAGAIIEYAQAANKNKTNEIGDKAKLRRATLAFYMGNFKWAQAQLDVLKAGTSKLIANDAFKLSTLIKENTDEDTTEQALQYYARSELLLKQNKQQEALQTLDTLQKLYAANSLIDDVLFLKAQVYEKSGEIQKAIECLTKITENYAADLLADDANYKLAQIFDYKINNKEKAKEYYKKIIFNFPASIFVDDARKRFRILREVN